MLDLRVRLHYINHEVVGVGVENVGETGIWGGSRNGKCRRVRGDRGTGGNEG